MNIKTQKLHSGVSGTAITVRINTKTAFSKISGVLDNGVVKIQLNSPPVEGKANKELIKLLSKLFNLPLRQFEIIAGENKRDKIIAIYDVEPLEIERIIKENIS